MASRLNGWKCGCVALVIGLAFVPMVGATDLAVWTFEVSIPITAGPHAAEGGVNGGQALGWHASGSTVYSNPVGNGSNESFSSNFWAIGDYYQFRTSTVGYHDITIAWDQTRSSTGPGTFDLAWSTDGTTFTTFLTDYTVLENNAANGGLWNSTTRIANYQFGPVAAPAALNNQANVYFRLINKVTAGGTGGTNRVDNVVIAGNLISGACCFLDNHCAVMTATACAAANGVYQGDDTTCAPLNPCPQYCADPNIIFSNGSPDFVWFLPAFRAGGDSAWAVDDVTFPDAMTITDLHWWAMDIAGFSWDQVDDVIVLRDDGFGGGPGAVVVELTGVPNTRTDTGTTAFGGTVWYYTLDLPPAQYINLEPGTYWIGMRPASQGTGGYSYWLTSGTGSGGTAYTRWGGSDWTNELYQVAFCLTGMSQNGACCLNDSTCQTVTEAACQALNGTWHSGQTCANFVCPHDTVVCEPQGDVNPTHPPTYWYDVTVGNQLNVVCDFHVQVGDPHAANYTNVVSPANWQFLVHQDAGGNWWASWWTPDCADPLPLNTTFRFQFDNPNDPEFRHWRTTYDGTNNPDAVYIVDRSENHAAEADGSGYRVHAPVPPWYWKDYNDAQADGFLPDFDQQQDFNADGQVDAGYCGPTAVANSIWWFHRKFPAAGIVPQGWTVLNLVQDLAERMATNGQTPSQHGHSGPGTWPDDMQSGIDSYLTAQGVNNLLFEHTQNNPTFEYIAQEVQRSQDVTLLVGFWHIELVQESPPGSGHYLVWWKRVGGHYLTVAGVNPDLKSLALSDPDADGAEHGASGVVRPAGVDHNHDGDNDPSTTIGFRNAAYDHAVHNNETYASHDFYVVKPSFSPGGQLALVLDGNPLGYGQDMWTYHQQENGGEFTPSQYTEVDESFLHLQGYPTPEYCQYYTEIEAAIVVSPFEGCGPIPDGTTCKATTCPDPSQQCLPKKVRHHIPPIVFPPYGTDNLSPTSGYFRVLDPSGHTLTFTITDGPPNITVVNRQDPVNMGDHREIQTEMVQLELVGGGGGGGGAYVHLNNAYSNHGRVVGATSPATDFPADSFFDIFVTIDIPDIGMHGLWHSSPIPLEDRGIHAVPPLGTAFQTLSGWSGVELLMPNGTPTGFTLIEVKHVLPPAPPEWEVIECECIDPNYCHIELDGGPHCTGECPPGFECTEMSVTNPDGTVDIWCECLPLPTGACCQPDGSCTVTTQIDCTGNWLGAGTSCTPNPCPQPPPNDNCSAWTPVIEGTYVFDTTYATPDGPNNWCPTGKNIWYCYTASCTGKATISLCGSSYDTVLAVYHGCGCYLPQAMMMACNDNFDCNGDGTAEPQSQVTVYVHAGHTYLLEVGGANQAAGPGVLTIACQPKDYFLELVNNSPVYAGGSGWQNGQWIYYTATNWWNTWWSNDFALDREKQVTIEFDVTFPTGPFPIVAFNWATADWTDTGSPPGDGQDQYIVRQPVEPPITAPGHYVFNTTIPFCPRWVSVDVQGLDVTIDGMITHICLPPVYGACCFTDGHCEQLTQLACTTAGGTQWLPGVGCDPNPCPLLNPRITLEASETCYEADDTVVVDLWMRDIVETIVGGQFFLHYDETKLNFVSADPAASVFTLEVYEAHNQAAGTLDYAVGIPHPGSGTSGTAQMARLTFTALAEICSATDLIAWRSHDPPTQLSDEHGQPVIPPLVDLDVADTTPPTIAGASATGGDVDGNCEYALPFTATITDDCCVDVGSITVDAVATNATVGTPSFTTSGTRKNVTVTGTVLVSNLSGCPAQVTLTFNARDCCDNAATPGVTAPANVNDLTPPTISGCPDDITVPAEAGVCTAHVSWTAPTAADNCTLKSFTSTHSPGDLFPQGTTTVTYTAKDECDNTTTCSFDVTVTGTNELMVNVQLGGAGWPATLTRCVTFELWNCPATAPAATLNEVLTFTSGLASNVVLSVPCGPYTCITARDKLHTLRRTADGVDGHFGIVGTQYVANFTGNPASGGDWLIGGNLNDSAWIDILDFGVFTWKYLVKYKDGVEVPGPDVNGNTTCATAYPHADVSGDGLVDNADFTFIQINFLKGREGNCCGQPGLRDGDEAPITRISVAELYRRGLGKLAVGDLNHDGWLDEQDMAAFLNGTVPGVQTGDLNCDGVINFGDIDPFVLALSDQAAYEARFPNCHWLNADCNGDGNVDFADIDPFVGLLSG